MKKGNPSGEQLLKLLDYFNRREHKKAENLARKITKKFPAHEFGWKVLGAVLSETDRLSESLHANLKVCKLKPSDAEAFNNLGVTQHRLGLFLDAEGSYKQAILLNKNFSEAYSNLGNTLLKQFGRLEEAKANCETAICLSPDFSAAHNNLGIVLKEMRELDESEKSFKQALALKPDFAEAHYNLGTALRSQNKRKLAEKSYRDAIKLKPNYVEALIELGGFLREQGNLDQAKVHILKALQIDPNNSLGQKQLSICKQLDVPGWHLSMMNDKERNKSYLEAIEAVIGDDDLVLEIGTGSGLLAMMAARSGAERVITCESVKSIANAAKSIINTNGYGRSIDVVQKKSTDLIVGADLPREADVVISEVLSAEFVGEGVRNTIDDANKRLLKKNGKMIPEAGAIEIALLGENQELGDQISVSHVSGFDLSHFNQITGSKFSVHLNDPPELLSESSSAFDFDLYNIRGATEKQIVIDLVARETGRCIGIIQWIKVRLCKNIYYENVPGQSSSHWPTPIYLFDEPLQVSKGQVLPIHAALWNDTVWFSLNNQLPKA